MNSQLYACGISTIQAGQSNVIMKTGDGGTHGAKSNESSVNSIFNVNDTINNGPLGELPSQDTNSGATVEGNKNESSLLPLNPGAADFAFTNMDHSNEISSDFDSRERIVDTNVVNGPERQYFNDLPPFTGYSSSQNNLIHQRPEQLNTGSLIGPSEYSSNPGKLLRDQGGSAAMDSILARAKQLHMQHTTAGDHVAQGKVDVSGFVYQVHFKRSSKYYTLHASAAHVKLERGDYVKVEADRGEDLGVVGDITPAEKFWAVKYSSSISKMSLPSKSFPKRILRLAYPKEVKELAVKTSDENTVTQICREILMTTHPLPINIVDSEYQFDRKKLIIYHNSKSRVDFREFVKDLYGVFKTRIWMQQYDLSNARRFPSGSMTSGGPPVVDSRAESKGSNSYAYSSAAPSMPPALERTHGAERNFSTLKTMLPGPSMSGSSLTYGHYGEDRPPSPITNTSVDYREGGSVPLPHFLQRSSFSPWVSPQAMTDEAFPGFSVATGPPENGAPGSVGNGDVPPSWHDVGNAGEQADYITSSHQFNFGSDVADSNLNDSFIGKSNMSTNYRISNDLPSKWHGSEHGGYHDYTLR